MTNRSAPRFLTCVAALTICGMTFGTTPANAAWWWPFGDDGLDYKVMIFGLDKDTREWISSLKIDEKNEVTPPKTVEQLNQEAMSLSEKIRKALESRGFYDAAINHKTVRKGEKHQLVYDIVPGPRYKIAKITFDWQGKPLQTLTTETLDVKNKSSVDAAAIQKDAAKLLQVIGDKSCLLSLSINPLLKLHGNSRTADLVYRIEHGPKANFGKTIIEGTHDVDNVVVLRAVDWKQGECFEQKKLENTRTNLIGNQLFASVRVTPDDEVDRLGQVPVTITVKERVPRTVTAGANYSTDQGYGVTGGWEHRNFFGKGEKFNTDAGIAQNEQFINNTLRLPAFLQNNQTLVLGFGAKRENQDAYTSNSINPSATIERKLSPHLNSGIGVAYTLTQTEDVITGDNKYGLLSFPGFLTYDTRNDSIDPRRGMLGNLTLTPYTETFGDGGQFLKAQTSLQTYFSNENMTWKPTLALKASLGSITGAEGDNVPSDIRFYAGGGGSVRGYDFQSLSPRVNGEPVGGSSMMTAIAEMRLRFNESFGGVAFVDAGNSYDTAMPSIGQDLYYGAGIGIRYYTAIGPLRMDIAMPLNGKDINQTGYALYISVGQAF